MKYANNPEEIPTKAHFAIIKFSSVYVEGDERSRTNPGHGYPAHTVTNLHYEYTEDKMEWEREIASLEKHSREKRYRAIVVGNAPVIKLETKVLVS